MNELDLKTLDAGRARAPVAKRKLVLSRHAHPAARASARRCTRSMPSAAPSTISPTMVARAAGRIAMLDRWRADIARLYAGKGTTALTEGLAAPIKTFGLKQEDFLAVIDGMEMDVRRDIRAPDWEALDLYCDRVASAVGRLSVKIFGIEEEKGRMLSHHLGRALADDQYPARPRSGRRDGPALPSQGGSWRMPASRIRTSPRCCAHPRLGEACGALVVARATAFCRGRHGHGALRAAKRAFAAHHGFGLSRAAREARQPRLDTRRERRSAPLSCNSCGPSCVTASCDGERNRTHYRRRPRRTLGRGQLASAPDREIVVHELARHAGGRCRSYFEPALGMTIDNGNHLLLSANDAALVLPEDDRQRGQAGRA